MTSYVPLDTAWIRSLRRREQPSAAALRDHLLAVHARYAGFTESCARRCVDAAGRNSYQWLSELVQPGMRMLDLACGSGVLLELCRTLFGDAVELSGVDMSADELALARQRLDDEVTLHRAFAQDLVFAERDQFDVVLCHWAMTLMNPVDPVLKEVKRVLASGGVFAAIVDGDHHQSTIYEDLNRLIFDRVVSECPGYAECDLGDARVRHRKDLIRLVHDHFPHADIEVAPEVVRLEGSPATLARESVGFYYASFVLSEQGHRAMVDEVEVFFAERGVFEMPIHRLVVRERAGNR
jgi:SAM-dependent methyltransferase